MKPTFFIIRTPKTVTVWSKELVILPGMYSHLLSANVADRIIDIMHTIPDVNNVEFQSEFINECIGNCSLRQREQDFNLLQCEMISFRRPNAVVTACNDDSEF